MAHHDHENRRLQSHFPAAVLRAAAGGDRQQGRDQTVAQHSVSARSGRALPDARRVRRRTTGRSSRCRRRRSSRSIPDRQHHARSREAGQRLDGRSRPRASRAASRDSSPRCRSTIRTRASPSWSGPSPHLGALGVQVFSNVNGLPLDDHGSCRCSKPPTGCAVRSAAPGARRRVRRLSRRERSRSTRSGGPSAGPTKRAPRCSGWCSRGCSIGCPRSGSSRITWAR